MSSSNEYLVPDNWQRSLTFDLKLPKGGKVLARYITIEDLADLGLMDQMDFFGQIAGKGPKPKETAKKKNKLTGETFKAMVGVINKIALSAVLKPELQPKPEPDENGKPGVREPGVLYVDLIPFEDKMYIFTKCFVDDMGGEGMENFRAQSLQALGAVQQKQSVQDDSEQSDGDQPKET